MDIIILDYAEGEDIKNYIEVSAKSNFNINKLFKNLTSEIFNKRINIQNPNPAIVKQIKKILTKNNLQNTSDNNYKNLVYANGNIDVIKNIVSLNTEVNLLDFWLFSVNKYAINKKNIMPFNIWISCKNELLIFKYECKISQIEE